MINWLKRLLKWNEVVFIDFTRLTLSGGKKGDALEVAGIPGQRSDLRMRKKNQHHNGLLIERIVTCVDGNTNKRSIQSSPYKATLNLSQGSGVRSYTLRIPPTPTEFGSTSTAQTEALISPLSNTPCESVGPFCRGEGVEKRRWREREEAPVRASDLRASTALQISINDHNDGS